ncbi:hypothetical protein [Actinomadura opuntiae]|uniref:hypothetical protein n=1 Tax=Actinomadura sp. OS1-43 TaxID=604315 RepID=UPI00255AE0F5|nr:hypothetical protein [Actinomadura sp. OS1-43]MDL4815983.1 hypothetical protein [Actinomadura sp. OS1-43]
MSWNESTGMVSRAFEAWKATDTEIRAFAKLALGWADRGFDEYWTSAGETANRNFNPEDSSGYEQADAFHHAVDGLGPDEFEWIVRATVIREAVTFFEVYLEQAGQEALDRYWWTDEAGQKYRMLLHTKGAQQSPRWPTLVRFHKELGNNVETDRVRFIRDLRHLLTHQRGELRTEERRVRFADDHVVAFAKDPSKHADIWDEASVGGQVQLRHERVMAILDDLGAVVRAADPVIWSIRWDTGALPNVDTLKSDSLIDTIPM